LLGDVPVHDLSDDLPGSFVTQACQVEVNLGCLQVLVSEVALQNLEVDSGVQLGLARGVLQVFDNHSLSFVGTGRWD